MSDNSDSPLLIGWAAADLTPDEPVLITGQFHARVSEGVLDPITATALALSSGRDDCQTSVVLVSCDLVCIPDGLRDAVREHLRSRLPSLDPRCVILSGTHTHTAPEIRVEADLQAYGGGISAAGCGVELPVMAPADYVALAAERVAAAIAAAWQDRRPGSIGYGFGNAVVGRNRRSTFYNGESHMYADTSAADFSHIEGYEDHTVNLLATWDESGTLRGLLVNVACPSQTTETLFQLSADYWHETRLELRRRFGSALFILPQCAAAGDQSPHIQVAKAAEERMRRLAGRTERQEIAVRIADAVTAALPHIGKERLSAPGLRHHVETIALSRRELTETDVNEALAETETLRTAYEKLRAELAAQPDLRQTPRWYVPITRCYRRMRWCEGVGTRFELAKSQPRLPVEVHVLRLADLALAANPFEYYLDFGVQIRARSPAVQTIVVQLAGNGTYVPTIRAVTGKSYGAIPASTPVGPEGGRELVEWTVATIAKLWDQS